MNEAQPSLLQLKAKLHTFMNFLFLTIQCFHKWRRQGHFRIFKSVSGVSHNWSGAGSNCLQIKYPHSNLRECVDTFFFHVLLWNASLFVEPFSVSCYGFLFKPLFLLFFMYLKQNFHVVRNLYAFSFVPFIFFFVQHMHTINSNMSCIKIPHHYHFCANFVI